MRSLIALLLMLFLTTACHPVLPAETLDLFSSQLQVTQSVAGALRPATADTRFVTLFPALRTAAAPRWLRPGTRLLYNLATATFARTQDDPTPSGGGLIEYDVVAQNRRNVVFVSTLINTDIQGIVPTPLAAQVAIAGTGDFWIAPAVLENAEEVQSDTFIVTRMPMDVGGAEYNVVRMQSNTVTDQGSGEEVWAFDVDSGLLVFYRQALYRLDGSQQSGTTASFVSQRRLHLPWRNGNIPDWVQQGVEWQLAGNQTLDVGVPPATSLPMLATIRITRVGALWSETFQQRTLYGTDAGSIAYVTGAMQLFGGYWLPPEAIAALKTGVVLDQDPVTGIQISVVQANRQRIVLAAAGQGHLTQLYYNARDGRLVGIYIEEHFPAATRITSLEAVQ